MYGNKVEIRTFTTPEGIDVICEFAIKGFLEQEGRLDKYFPTQEELLQELVERYVTQHIGQLELMGAKITCIKIQNINLLRDENIKFSHLISAIRVGIDIQTHKGEMFVKDVTYSELRTLLGTQEILSRAK